MNKSTLTKAIDDMCEAACRTMHDRDGLFFTMAGPTPNTFMVKGRAIEKLLAKKDFDASGLWQALTTIFSTDNILSTCKGTEIKDGCQLTVQEPKSYTESRALPGGVLNSNIKTAYEDILEKHQKAQDKAKDERYHDTKKPDFLLWDSEGCENGYHNYDGTKFEVGKTKLGESKKLKESSYDQYVIYADSDSLPAYEFGCISYYGETTHYIDDMEVYDTEEEAEEAKAELEAKLGDEVSLWVETYAQAEKDFE